MAISANVIFDVRTGGSDTANGGAFDPSVTAGMNTDGAATSATGNSPVFTSASYNFVAGDVGAWLYIASGTNWTPGWYQIASVATNAATLSAGIGAAALMLNQIPLRMNVVSGCATVASPTSATWTMDYSQQNSAARSYTDLASVGAGLLVSSAAFPFGKQMVGNMIVVASGTNFTAGNYIISAVSVGLVATVTGAGNITTGAGVAGVGGMGGALATPGKAGQRRVAANKVFLMAGTYTLTTNSMNVSGGIYSPAGGNNASAALLVGWSSERTATNTGTPPEINAGSVNNAIVISGNATNFCYVRNLVVDCNNQANTRGVSFGSPTSYLILMEIWVKNATNYGIVLNGGRGTTGYRLRASGCSGTAAISLNPNTEGATLLFSEAYNNTTVGIELPTGGAAVNCISSSNSGATSVGFKADSGATMMNCIAYGNGSAGFNAVTTGAGFYLNCLAEGNAGAGWQTTGVRPLMTLINCGGYNNTGGNYDATQIIPPVNFIANVSGSFFTNAATGDFSLNNIAGRGALARNTGISIFPDGLTTSYNDIGAAQNLYAGPTGAVAANLLKGFIS